MVVWNCSLVFIPSKLVCYGIYLIQKSSLHAYTLATYKMLFHFRFHSTSYFRNNNCHSHNGDGAIWINRGKRHEDKNKILLPLCFFSPAITVGMRLSFTLNIFIWSALSFGGI